jgi:hypothetical protein
MLFKEALFCFRISNDYYIKSVAIGIFSGFLAIAVHMMVDIYASELALGVFFILGSLSSAIIKIGSLQYTKLVFLRG